jgi:hypothetical protein
LCSLLSTTLSTLTGSRVNRVNPVFYEEKDCILDTTSDKDYTVQQRARPLLEPVALKQIGDIRPRSVPLVINVATSSNIIYYFAGYLR